MPAYKWKPIEPIPDELLNYADEELAQLFTRWQETRKDFDPEVEKEFLERLKREWAIETGKIENLYTLTRGITETLIKRGLDVSLIRHNSTNKSPEIVHAFVTDQHTVVNGLFDFVGQTRKLSNSYICEMHQIFTENQDYIDVKDPITGEIRQARLLKGQWKKLPNNPLQLDNTIHEYAPPEQVESEMDRLISLHNEYIDKKISPEVHAAWLHHAFTQIHPFQDGNGRVARALASIIFIKAGMFPLVVKDEQRGEYIDALEAADFGDLELLVELFSNNQKDSLDEAIEYGLEVDSSKYGIKESTQAYADRKKLIDDRHQAASELLGRFSDIVKKEANALISDFNNRMPNLKHSKIHTQSIQSSNNPSITVTPDDEYKHFPVEKRFVHHLQFYDQRVSDVIVSGYCLSSDGIPLLIRTIIEINKGKVIKDFSLTDFDRINRIDFHKWLMQNINQHLSKVYQNLR